MFSARLGCGWRLVLARGPRGTWLTILRESAYLGVVWGPTVPEKHAKPSHNAPLASRQRARKTSNCGLGSRSRGILSTGEKTFTIRVESYTPYTRTNAKP